MKVKRLRNAHPKLRRARYNSTWPIQFASVDSMFMAQLDCVALLLLLSLLYHSCS